MFYLPLFKNAFFSLKVFVSTLNHNLAWNIAQQLFTELQKTNNLTDLHTISHIVPFNF